MKKTNICKSHKKTYDELNNQYYEIILNDITFLYLIIPVIIFLLGWVKLWISGILTILLITSIIFRIKKYKYPKKDIKKYLSRNLKEILCVFLIVSGLVFLSGIGGFVFQNFDHIYRNSIFKDLINNNWPIYLPKGGNFTKDVIFSYYFAIWLPSALVGKAFGINAGYIALYLWCVIGVYITMRYFKIYYKKNFFVPILLFIGFSGLDIIEQLLYGGNILHLLILSSHLEWTTGYQFSSFTTQLFWVFNQAIPAWLLTLAILNEKDSKRLVVLLACSLIFSTLPTVGLAFVTIYKVYFTGQEKPSINKIINKTKELFTFENILIGIPLLIIFLTFVMSNSTNGTVSFGISIHNILPIIISIVFEFLLYYLLVIKYCKDKYLIIISLISLLICPLITISSGGDFCMRASIPGLMTLFVLLLEAVPKMNKRDFIIFFIIFTIGAITPLNEIKRTVYYTNKNTKREAIVLITSPNQQNFYGYKDESLFVKFFARKK